MSPWSSGYLHLGLVWGEMMQHMEGHRFVTRIKNLACARHRTCHLMQPSADEEMGVIVDVTSPMGAPRLRAHSQCMAWPGSRLRIPRSPTLDPGSLPSPV